MAREYQGTLIGAFTTVQRIRDLPPLEGEPVRWPDLAPSHPAILCYVDAQIDKGPPPPMNGPAPRRFDRVVIGVLDGNPELIAAGYRDRMVVQAP